MPTPVENLTVRSTSEQRRSAISSCMSTMVGEGKSQEVASAICLDQVDKAMGTSESRTQR